MEIEIVNYHNTNEYLYEDIALWEKTEGKSFFEEMPLSGNQEPLVLDFGYGFGQYLFACAYAYPKATIYGIDRNIVCQNEVSEKIKNRRLNNITLINKDTENLEDFQSNSLDLILIYDNLHASGSRKYRLFEEAHRVLKAGGCLSVLPFHLSNWRDRQENKKKYTPKMVIKEISEYGFQYEGTCTTKGIHWEKCHTHYYIQKGNITFDSLERMDVMNFIKL